MCLKLYIRSSALKKLRVKPAEIAFCMQRLTLEGLPKIWEMVNSRKGDKVARVETRTKPYFYHRMLLCILNFMNGFPIKNIL